MLLSFLLLLLCCPSHAITWEDRGGEAIRLGVVTATTTTPSGTYYAVTCNGVIAKSRDGGVTWAPVSLPQSGIHFNSVKFFDDTHGIAVGDGVGTVSEIPSVTGYTKYFGGNLKDK